MNRKPTRTPLTRDFTLALCAAATLILIPAAFVQKKLQIAGNFAGEHLGSVALDQVFKKEVARLSNNPLQVDVFPAMQLGGDFLSLIVPELEAVGSHARSISRHKYEFC